MRILKAYLQYKFTVQRVTEVSFFEVTTSTSRAVVNGFPLRLARVVRQFLLSISVSFLDSTSLLGFREFFPCLSANFFKRARESEVKLRRVVYKV